MKLLLAILSSLILSSCAHHHGDVDHHHHKNCAKNCDLYHEKGEMFNKHCAQSIIEGDLHVKGSDEFKLKHAGEIYYFSSKKKLENFKKHLKENTQRARRNWDNGSARR